MATTVEGNTIPPTTLASDMYRVSPRVIAHTKNAARAGTVSTGHIASTAPKPVATPLPPRNPIHGEKQWPRIAQTATKSHPHAASVDGIAMPNRPPSQPETSTGAAPLRASRRKQQMPKRLPSTRPTLVDPGFPEPTWRMSTP